MLSGRGAAGLLHLGAELANSAFELGHPGALLLQPAGELRAEGLHSLVHLLGGLLHRLEPLVELDGLEVDARVALGLGIDRRASERYQLA